MNISLDISPLHNANNIRGVGSYTRSLLEALQKYGKEHNFQLAKQPEDILNADVIHYPYFDLYFHTLPMFKKAPSIVTIHDVIPLLYPEQFPPGVRGKMKLYLQLVSLKGIKAILTDSEQSKLDIHTHLDVALDMIHVTYLAADPAFRQAHPAEIGLAMQKYSLERPYFLYVGDVNYSKNIAVLLEGYAPMHREFDLVFVSAAFKHDIPETRAILEHIKRLGISKQVKILDSVPAKPKIDLISLYSGAEAYIQPSLYEGFGLPVLEAMACGTPVISTHGGSLAEVAADAAIIFDANSPHDLTAKLDDLLHMSDANKRQLMLDAKKHQRKFSWKQCAQETIAVYQAVTTQS